MLVFLQIIKDTWANEQLCFGLQMLTESCHNAIYQALEDDIEQST